MGRPGCHSVRIVYIGSYGYCTDPFDRRFVYYFAFSFLLHTAFFSLTMPSATPEEVEASTDVILDLPETGRQLIPVIIVTRVFVVVLELESVDLLRHDVRGVAEGRG